MLKTKRIEAHTSVESAEIIRRCLVWGMTTTSKKMRRGKTVVYITKVRYQEYQEALVNRLTRHDLTF